MCGIPDSNGRMATILVFNPRETGTYDRIFIFAHELGHALHFALTGNIEVMPDGFDAFNKSILVNLQTLKEKQEAFADAVALAILNVKGLGTHFPTHFSKGMSPCFASYIKTVTEKALAGNTSE